MIRDFLVKLLRRALCGLEGHEWELWAGNRATCEKCPKELSGKKQLEAYGLEYSPPKPLERPWAPTTIIVDPNCPLDTVYALDMSQWPASPVATPGKAIWLPDK